MPMTQAQFEEEFKYNLVAAGFEGLTKNDVKSILETLGETVHDSLREQMPRKGRRGRSAPVQNGNATVVIRGLGRMTVRDRPARMGRNPATGETIKIKASKKIRMTIAKPMRDSLGVK